MIRPIVACVSVVFACGLAADDKPNPIKARLDEARTALEKDNEKAKADLLAQLDMKLEAAQKAGDLALVKKLRAERDAFAEGDELPKTVSTMGYKAALKKSFGRMTAAFVQARKEYTQAGKIAEAEAVDAELAEFLKSGGVKPPAPGGSRPARPGQPQVRVISAVWGAGNRNADVTERVASLLAEGKTVVVNGPELGTDPAPNVMKSLRLKLQVGDQILEMTIPDRGEFRLTPAK